MPRHPDRPDRRGGPHPGARGSLVGRTGRFARRLLVGVLVGGGTIFGAKAERDQHWSTPPTMQVDQHAADTDARGDGDPDGTGDRPERRLPTCV